MHRTLFWVPSNSPHCRLPVVDFSFACWLLLSANIHYLPQCRQGRGIWLSTTHTCLFISPDGRVLERFGASVPHMHCMAWIQQSSCSKALLPQWCFSAIKEYSSPSCPPSCTAILAQFGCLFFLPLSPFLLFYSLHSQSFIPQTSTLVGIGKHPLCRFFLIYYQGVYRSVLIKRWNH